MSDDQIEVISGDPDEFCDEIRRFHPGKERYLNADQWRDFQAVFLGESTAAQGKRVLWELLGWSGLFDIPGANEPLERYEGRRRLGRRLFLLVNAVEAKPEMPAEKEKDPHERL